MKHCALLLLAVSIAPAQTTYLNGMAARAVIGQKTFTANDTPAPSSLPDLYQPGIGQWLLGSPSGVAYANGMLFVADSNNIAATPVNNRVLIYYDVNQIVPAANASIAVPSGSNPVLCPVCSGNFGSTYGAAGTVLGQPDFDSTNYGTSATTLRNPTAVASDGKVLAVADTDNNRVLLWLKIPAKGNNAAPADVVLGQPDMNSVVYGSISSSNLLGPQGVWIQNGKLYVADTRQHRILIWNSIPTKNNTPADLVLGQPNFTTTSEEFVGQTPVPPTAKSLKNPTSVTSDGTHLFVADLGYNRVLIWNSIPTQTDQAADVVLGQPDMSHDYPAPPCLVNNLPTVSGCNNSILCPSSGVDPNEANGVRYPPSCEYTVNFPRYALSDGKRLYVADGGFDRVLVYSIIPTTNGAPANIVLGQPDFLSDIVSDTTGFFTPNLTQGAPNTTRTPTGLAWDGTNLYVATPYDRRVMVFTPAIGLVAPGQVNNAASLKVYAEGIMSFGGTIQANDVIQIVTNTNGNVDTTTEKTYSITVLASDTIATIIQKVADTINGTASGTPDPYVFVRVGAATSSAGPTTAIFIARSSGAAGNSITVTTTVTNSSSTTASSALTVSGGTPSGGGAADTVSPGALVEIDGEYLSDQTAGSVPDAYLGTANGPSGLPTDLGGVEVYVDGNRCPLYYVSPKKIVAQLPYKLNSTNASSLYVRSVRADGSVYVSTAVGLPIAQQNPGIFATGAQEPRAAVAFHGSSYATAQVLINGITAVGDLITITIDNRPYTYTAQLYDTNAIVRDIFISQINANPSERVTAVAASQFTAIRLFSKFAGPLGEGIVISANSAVTTTSPTGNTGPGITLNVSNSALCCANVAGAPITPNNPAIPGETITIYASGVGPVSDLYGIQQNVVEGVPYAGPANNQPLQTLSALVGGLTANVVSGGLIPGAIGIYEVQLELNTSLTTNPQTQMTIAQYIYTSNIATIPVVARTGRPPN